VDLERGKGDGGFLDVRFYFLLLRGRGSCVEYVFVTNKVSYPVAVVCNAVDFPIPS